MIEALFQGFSSMLQPFNILMLCSGTFVGLVFGALPGMSAVTGIAITMPLTYGMEPFSAMLFFGSIISCTSLGGSIPAILLNTPGTAPNAAACFDGFPLSQQGQAGRVIAVSSLSTFFGTMFGIIVLIVLIPVMQRIVMFFRSPDFFWLVLFGLAAITAVSREDLLKGMASGGLGILFSFIGAENPFSVTRFTMDSKYLWGGISLVPFFIGLFALSSLIQYASQGGTIAVRKITWKEKKKWEQISQAFLDIISRPILVLRSAVIGTIVGIIPAVGGTVASFLSYTWAKKSSKDPDSFGKGNIEGVIAAQVATDSKEGGSLVPTVSFGIPGSPDTAVLLGAFILHGLQPGPLFLRDHMNIVMSLVMGVTFSQVIASSIVLFSAFWLARLTFVKVHYLAPIVAILCFIGSYSLRLNIWDVFLTLIMGTLGYFLRRYNFNVVSFAIGFILGSLAELSFHQSLMSSYGSYKIFFSSVSSIILILLILALLVTSLRIRRKDEIKNL